MSPDNGLILKHKGKRVKPGNKQSMRLSNSGKNKFFGKNKQYIVSSLTERTRNENKPIYIIDRIVFKVIDTVL